MWADLSDDDRDRWTNWVASTCRHFGATRYTAHSVAALFAGDLDTRSVDNGPDITSPGGT